MSAPLQFPDGVYDHTNPWQSNAERIAQERAFMQGDREMKLEAIALMSASPATRNREIRTEMTAPLNTPMWGAEKYSPTINDVLAGRYSNSGNLYDSAPTDFSGTQAGQEGSSFPSIPTYP